MSGLSGFAAGFAQGFINERNRRLDKETELDKMSLQYRLKELADQKETWQKKQQQEEEWVRNGKALAQTLGDPDFAADATRMLSTGIDANTIMERYQKGNFKKVAPDEQTFAVKNPDLGVNNPTSNLIKTPMDAAMQNSPVAQTQDNAATMYPNIASTDDSVPAGDVTKVDPNKFPNGYDPKTAPKPVTNADLQTVAKQPIQAQVQQPQKKGLFGITADDFKINDDPNNIDINRVDKEAQQIAPSLFDFKPGQHNADFQKILDTPGSRYKFVPDTVEDKVGNLSQEINNFKSAQQIGDKVGMAKYQQHIDAIKQSMQIQAQYKAQEQGISYHTMAIIDGNGKWVDSMPVTDDPNTGQPVNLTTGKAIQLAQGQHMIPLNEKQADDIRSVQDKFQETKSKYDIAASSTAEAFHLGREITDLMAKPGNEEIASGAPNWVRLTGDVWANIKGIKDALDKQATSAATSAESGDQNQLSKDIGTMETTVSKLEQSIGKLPQNILSDRNVQLTIDKTLFDAKMKLLAYKIAQSNGVTGNNASNKDVSNFLSIIGNDNSTNPTTQAAVTSLLQMMKVRMDQAKAQVDSIGKSYTKTFGFDIGLEGTRMGDLITPPGQHWTPDQIADRKFYDGIESMADRASQYTQEKYNAAKQMANPTVQQQTQIPTILSKEDFMKLPSGAHFIDPDGNERIKP